MAAAQAAFALAASPASRAPQPRTMTTTMVVPACGGDARRGAVQFLGRSVLLLPWRIRSSSGLRRLPVPALRIPQRAHRAVTVAGALDNPCTLQIRS